MGSESKGAWIEFGPRADADEGSSSKLVVRKDKVVGVGVDRDNETTIYMASGKRYAVGGTVDEAKRRLGIGKSPGPCPDCAQQPPNVTVKVIPPGWVPITTTELAYMLRRIPGSGSCETCQQARELIARYRGDYHWGYPQWFRDRVDAAKASEQVKPDVTAAAMSPGWVPATAAELIDALRTITGSCSCETCQRAHGLIAKHEGDYYWSYPNWFRDRVDAAKASDKVKP